MTPKEYLNQAYKIERRINIIGAKVSKLRSQLEYKGISYDGSGASHSTADSDGMSSTIADIADYERRQRELADVLIAKRFEIESVIMELPYVLECGVSAAPDEVRGQIVKASIVLTKGTEPTEELKKEIQQYVKTHTAPYKYPRLVVFRDFLPKTTSGKIQRNKL